MRRIKKGITLLLCLFLVFLLCPTQIQAATKVKLNKTNVSINIGESIRLKVTGTKNKITWSSLNKGVASVNANGKVTGKSVGKTVIQAKIKNKMLKCTVQVKNSSSILSVEQTSLEIENNGSIEVTYKGDEVVSCTVDGATISCKWDNGNEIDNRDIISRTEWDKNEWKDDHRKLYITGLRDGISYIYLSTRNDGDITIKVTVKLGNKIDASYAALANYFVRAAELNLDNPEQYYIQVTDRKNTYDFTYDYVKDIFIFTVWDESEDIQGMVELIINPLDYEINVQTEASQGNNILYSGKGSIYRATYVSGGTIFIEADTNKIDTKQMDKLTGAYISALLLRFDIEMSTRGIDITLNDLGFEEW
jgi:hypothetical protein